MAAKKFIGAAAGAQGIREFAGRVSRVAATAIGNWERLMP